MIKHVHKTVLLLIPGPLEKSRPHSEFRRLSCFRCLFCLNQNKAFDELKFGPHRTAAPPLSTPHRGGAAAIYFETSLCLYSRTDATDCAGIDGFGCCLLLKSSWKTASTDLKWG